MPERNFWSVLETGRVPLKCLESSLMELSSEAVTELLQMLRISANSLRRPMGPQKSIILLIIKSAAMVIWSLWEKGEMRRSLHLRQQEIFTLSLKSEKKSYRPLPAHPD